jgi:hypothetical protein
VWLENSGYLRFRYGGSNKAYITADSSGNVCFDADGGILQQANNQIYMVYNEDGGSHTFTVFNDTTIAMDLDDNMRLSVTGDIHSNDDITASDDISCGGDIKCGGTFRASNGDGGKSGSFGYKDDNNVNHRLVFKDGILVDQYED